jgi:hypothetical protein
LTSGPRGREATDSTPEANQNASTVTTLVQDERIAATEAALAAWGRFAVTGRVDALEESFDVAGPQFRHLADEAGTITAAPPGPPAYQVTLAEPVVEGVSADEAVVASTVVWARPGETDQTYRWEIVVRRGSTGRWLLWTVRSNS